MSYFETIWRSLRRDGSVDVEITCDYVGGQGYRAFAYRPIRNSKYGQQEIFSGPACKTYHEAYLTLPGVTQARDRG